jgi:hypothetical protein
MEPKPINTRAYIAMYMHDKTIATNYYVHSGLKGSGLKTLFNAGVHQQEKFLLD